MWTRLGIVASVVWMLGFGIYWIVQISRCNPQQWWSCDFIAGTFWSLPDILGFWRLGLWGNALFASVAFPVLVWAALWIAIGVTQWIWAGRQTSN
jgi:hypothetical protein